MSNSKNTFEESLKKLEKIVEKLEDGNVNLDDSIKSFEEGVALVKECQKQLSEAEIKIQTLLEDGNVEPTEAT
ncbi:MAG: exodeoxyribonuclease VII small subunit [Pseudomonadota bacterium]|jgi:exodeoxyribonuclease VII small subunit|nr:exodeoxyribonuclease VII small subunit [Pseudomonadota bacterium]MEC7999842.1 exodeoxyribonuclease VII small subunit [Pseudomonadota bacterium]|tara:strand:+ start:1073 stop:1291 length:219 start_codon:yes stop_codon:yes gene_type:complete